MCVPFDAMDKEDLQAGPEGVLLADGGGGNCFLVSRLELAAEGSGATIGCVGDGARGAHDEG